MTSPDNHKLNNLTNEWGLNIEDYQIRGRLGKKDQIQARVDAGGSKGDGLAILHGPDQYAGGRPNTYDGLGSNRINSSIGSQWKQQRDVLFDGTISAVVDIPETLQRFVYMNTRLTPR